MAYTTSTLISNYLQRSLTANETAFLAILIPAIERWIDKKLGTTFADVAPSDRFYDGGVQNLDIDPCKTITAVRSVDYDGDEITEYETRDYVAEPINQTFKRELRLRSGHWPKGKANIKVSATFTEYEGSVPADIQAVATKIAAEAIVGSSQSSNSDIASESLEGHTITYKNVNEIIDKITTEDPLVISMLDLRRELYVD